MNLIPTRILAVLSVFLAAVAVMYVSIDLVSAQVPLLQYKDTISDSAPNRQSNHTISFTMPADVSPGGYIEVTPPPGFETLNSPEFATRNVELYVNAFARTASVTPSAVLDQVTITPGTPGKIRYDLATGNPGLTSGDTIELLIGNHTSGAREAATLYSTSTGTTTILADIEPIVNSPDLGRHDLLVEIYDGGLVARSRPVIFLIEPVVLPNIDTTEEIPPYRFNGQPTSTVGGTTPNVEIALETDEFSECRYDTASGTPFAIMPSSFLNTGLIFHSTIVPVTPGTVARFYVRCIDDEGNFNTDDYPIIFTVNNVPTGTANTEGDTEGDGTGSGNSGGGDGNGGGGTSGQSNGEQPLEGGSSGSGGSGGGGGGGSGGSSGNSGGGGFESTEGPFQSGDGRVIVNGYAYPNSEVTILVDGERVDTVRANGSGRYSITIDDIARGAYTFGVYAEDENDVRSSTYSTAFTVTGARTSALSGVNVPPSILIEPNPADPGDVITISGYALPNATVTLETGRDDSSTVEQIQLTSDSRGRFETTINTTGLSIGTYRARAQAVQPDGLETGFSDFTFNGIGQQAAVPNNGDFNRDGRVNLVDFSILLFWWNTDGGDSDPSADINQDGRVSLTDFSILLFQWTG